MAVLGESGRWRRGPLGVQADALAGVAEPARPSPLSPPAATTPLAPNAGALATTLATLTTPLHCDGADWCPTPGWRRLLAVSCYQLDEGTGVRRGLLSLHDTRGDGLAPAGAAWEGAGVFDAAWAPAARGDADGGPLLALALADGTLEVLRVKTVDEGESEGASVEGAGAAAPLFDGCEAGQAAGRPFLALTPLAGAVVTGVDDTGGSGPAAGPAGAMALYVDWCRAPCGEARLAAATSAGGLAVADLGAERGLEVITAWQSHSLEAWTVAWDAHDPCILFSGADDAAFKGWDVRAPPGGAAGAALATPTFVNSRVHGAGVCCVAPSPHTPHRVATGSYDEAARLWDTRALARPVETTSLACGGGVWRLRWHPEDGSLLLAATMHDGFKVLALASGGLAVADHYPHQRTLAYGADWCASPGLGGTGLVATASFYERAVHLWAPAERLGSSGPGGGG